MSHTNKRSYLKLSLYTPHISRSVFLETGRFFLFLFQNEPVNYSVLFFDLDRTLWDYDRNAEKSLEIIYDEFLLDTFFESPNEFFEIYTRHNDRLWDAYRKGMIRKDKLRDQRFFNTLQEKGVENATLASDIGERYMYLTPRLSNLLPNTIEVLDYLIEKKYRLFIITNGFIETQRRKMKASGLEAYFERMFSSEEIGKNKPEPDIFHWAVSSIHAKKKQCLMIGDDVNVDIAGANNYGIDAVWFNPEKEKSNIRCTYIISDLIELTNFL